MKITKEFLIEEYKNKLVVQIARDLNISNSVMYRMFSKFKIPRRTQKEAGVYRIVKRPCID